MTPRAYCRRRTSNGFGRIRGREPKTATVAASAAAASVAMKMAEGSIPWSVMPATCRRIRRVAAEPSHEGIRHAVSVQAETLYEAVALAVQSFREHDCAPGPASTIEVESRSPSVTHSVRMAKVREWLNGAAKSPSEKLVKERLKGMLAS